MSLRNVLLLLTAILVAAGAVYVAQSWLDSERAALDAMRQGAPEDETDTTYVLVAKAHLSRGTFVKPEDLRWQAWPDESLDKTYVTKDGGTPQDFAGAVVRYPVVSGEPITSQRIVRPGEQGFMAAALEPGMRAVTIPVNVTTGVAGFVFPGDRVDLLLTLQFKQGRRTNDRYVTETLMPDIRVIAIDQRLTSEQEGPRVAKTITFEVTPKDVERITVAQRLGGISLSLRSLAEDESTAIAQVPLTDSDADADLAALSAADVADLSERGFTWDQEVSTVLAGVLNGDRVTIIRGRKSGTIGTRSGSGSEDDEDESEAAAEGEEPRGQTSLFTKEEIR